MSNSVTIPSGTPLTLHGRFFAQQLLGILGKLSPESNNITDFTPRVVGKIMGYDKSYFEKFNNSQTGEEGYVSISAVGDFLIKIEEVDKKPGIKVYKLEETGGEGPLIPLEI